MCMWRGGLHLSQLGYEGQKKTFGFISLLFYVWECFACMCVCAPYTYLEPMKLRREFQIPGQRSYSQVGAGN